MKKFYLLIAEAAFLTLPAGAENIGTLTLADSSRVYDLDEVVVVSQNKEYTQLRKQPLSSNVFTHTELYNLWSRDLRDVSSYVPSFVMPDYGARFTSSIYVRGIGSRINSPSMGIYIDDIPLMNKSTFNGHIYELDRVDVLRGPQGTLYGINTEGGLVRQYTKTPMNYQGTNVNLGIGSRFYRKAEVAHYAKLSDKLALSVAAFYDGTNGFWKNALTGERADNMDEAGGRMRLVYQPTDKFSIDWMTDYQWVRQKAYPYGLLNPSTGDVEAEPNQDHQSKYKRNMLTTGLAVKYKGYGFDFASNTSYQLLRDNLLMDNDYSNVDFITVDQSQLGNALTQEFTFKSNSKSRWHWTSGAFLSYQWLKTTAPNKFGTYFPQMLEQQIMGSMLKSMMDRGMTQQQAAAAIAARGGVHVNIGMDIPCLFHTPQFNIGIFHESNIDLTEHLTLTLGLRYDFTRAKIDFDTRGISLNPAFSIMGTNISPARIYTDYIGSDKANFNQLLPKFGLTYKFDNGSNVYATVSKGYRAGGFNVQMFGDIIQSDLQKAIGMLQGGASLPEVVLEHHDEACDPILEGVKFKPEESWNYEAGMHLDLFNNLIHADFSLFYMQIRNQQLSVFTSDYGFGRRMVNAGKSYSCGLETTLRGSAFGNHMAWSASYGYTHAVFKDYTTKASSSATAAVIDYSKNKVPYVPAHTLAAMVDHRFDFNDSFVKALTVGANINAQGKIWWDDANTYYQKFYAVLGAHVAADFGLCTVNFWGRNLTDSRYNTFAFSSKATGKEVFMAQRGNPFQCGIDLSFHF